ncbi:hypothetical protein WA026_000366 [Henosepilachna vigintioctopunctata]|uniref:Uncharacterized protein n=1 Tax=Henosepilachna vigintioctopunctata TaxID=420089 RepID=A0AAW1V844_9CUCU
MNLLLPLLVVCISTFVYSTPLPYDDQVVEADNTRSERQAPIHDHHDAVDFGGHKGDHGSFGWYADFPIFDH